MENVNGEKTIDNEVSNEEQQEEIVDQNENIEEEITFEEDSEIDELNTKIDELTDKNTRLLAEYQNFKRRSLEENLKAVNNGKKLVFTEIIETVDNLERALMHIDFESDEVDELAKGVKMVYDNLVKKLENLGLQEVDCSGLVDHNLHSAVGTDCISELENDQIIAVLQKGYILDDILIRPAMVKVNQK